MKRVRFSQRSYVDGVLYQPGDEAVILDHHAGDHIEDLTPPPVPTPPVMKTPVIPPRKEA